MDASLNPRSIFVIFLKKCQLLTFQDVQFLIDCFIITNSPYYRTGGIYIAAQDQGACMSLVSLRVYYNYCKETVHSLAKFEETMTGKKAASLVNVPGTCIENAEMNADKGG